MNNKGNFKTITKTSITMNTYVRCILVMGLLLLASCATSMSMKERDALEKAKAEGAPIFLEGVKIGTPNSAGGKRISWRWHNLTSKTVKYASFEFQYFNAVGDEDKCSISTPYSIEETGPIKPGERRTRQFTDLCYDTDIVCGEITSAKFSFMDGSELSLSRQQIDSYHFIEGKNNCRANPKE